MKSWGDKIRCRLISIFGNGLAIFGVARLFSQSFSLTHSWNPNVMFKSRVANFSLTFVFFYPSFLCVLLSLSSPWGVSSFTYCLFVKLFLLSSNITTLVPLNNKYELHKFQLDFKESICCYFTIFLYLCSSHSCCNWYALLLFTLFLPNNLTYTYKSICITPIFDFFFLNISTLLFTGNVNNIQILIIVIILRCEIRFWIKKPC